MPLLYDRINNPLNCVGVAVLALAVLGGACGLPVVQPTTTGSVSPERSPTALSDAEIAEAVTFRKRYGLRADDVWVRSVAADAAAQEAIAGFGVPLMPSERLDLLRRRTDRDLFLQVVGYGSLFPDEYAGAYDDRAGRGAIVVSFSHRAERHRTALLHLLPDGSPVIVEEVEWSSKELERFVRLVDADRSWFRTIGVVYLTSGRRITDNYIYVSYSGSQDAAAEIEAHYGHPSWLKAEREGPLPWVGARGDLVIVVTDAAGRPMQVWCDLSSEDPRVKLGGELRNMTDRNGLCSFRDMPAVAYQLTLHQFVNDDYEPIHHERFVVDRQPTIVRIVLPES